MLECFLCMLFQIRAEWALHLLTQPTDYGSIAYEYEKNAYPLALADLWAGNEKAEAALMFLQQEDLQAIETDGIDLYSGFVLKGQMRKYFGFGDWLEPSYRDRMYQAMDWLTRTDPLSREANPPRKFWARSQDDCTTLVDCRNTDNLRAMRETSVYLMAEETGNEMTRQLYQSYLERYVSTLLDIGMGEWDSPTYHGHTTAAYLNLYDFAQDREVHQLAQAGLDWLFASAALKYWRGTWTAPGKRWGKEGAANFFWLYFGDAAPPETAEKDWIHALTSDYRPPEAVLRLARREFPKPLEVRRTHPHYENWKPERYGPAFYETLYFGHTFQLGSLAQGTGGDWQGFGLTLLQGAGTDAMPVEGGGTQAIAQYQNLIVWLGDTAPQLTLPQGTVETTAEVTFVKTEQTWLALRRLENGFVLEVGELPTHGTFEQFKAQVLRRSRLTIEADVIEYQGSLGNTVALHPQGEQLPLVWRDSVLHNWQQHGDMSSLLQAIPGLVSVSNGSADVSLRTIPTGVPQDINQTDERQRLPAQVPGIHGFPLLEWSRRVSSVSDLDSAGH